MAENTPLTGRCLCSSIQYQISGPPLWVGHCHCTMCRRQAGAAFMTWVSVKAENMSFTKGKPKSYRSSDKATRQFCADCGTPLVFQFDANKNKVDIAASTLDNPAAVTPKENLYYDTRLEHFLDLKDLPVRKLD